MKPEAFEALDARLAAGRHARHAHRSRRPSGSIWPRASRSRYDKLILCTGGRARTLARSRRGPAGRLHAAHHRRCAGAGRRRCQPASASARRGRRMDRTRSGGDGAQEGRWKSSSWKRMGRLCERTVPAEISELPAGAAPLARHAGRSSAPASIAFAPHGRRRTRRPRSSDGRRTRMRRRRSSASAWWPTTNSRAKRGWRARAACVVDSRCRTSDPDILAAGDVAVMATAWAGRRLRLESWQNAQEQGIAAARAALGIAVESSAAAVVLVGPVRHQPADLRHAGAFASGGDAG